MIEKFAYTQYKNILFVFPHPDDEVLGSGGLMHIASNAGIKTTLLVLTKGERGTVDASLQESLKKIRVKEVKKASGILRVNTLIQEDLGDGQLAQKPRQVKKCIHTCIKKIKPDLIVTYDPSGLYGHPDHMITSDVVSQLVAESSVQMKLLYTVLPPFMYHFAKLPTHMANDPKFIHKRKAPNRSFFVGIKALAKVKALYAHASQLEGFKKSLPFSLPLQTYALIGMWEYFYLVPEKINH